MFYLISGSYSPNTAPCNRIMAYVRALSELGVRTRVVFFFPDRAFSKFEGSFDNVVFEYFWDKHYINVPKLKKISQRLYMRQFVKRLRRGDKVLVYGFPDLVVDLSKIDSISVYSEKTEHPDASFVCHVKNISISNYLEACRKIAGVIVISQGLKNYFIENGVPAEQVHVVNMIADTTRFNNLEKQPSDNYIAYCGTASNNKDGVDQLVKAFALVVKKHTSYKLIIIGSTPSKQQRFDNLELVRSLGIENNVVFKGVVPAAEMPQMLKNANILALDRPDNLQAKYGFPTKLGEYLLTGNPVVITRVGDIPLFLKDGESALIAEPNNPEDFAGKLCWAIEHIEEAKLLGKNGKLVAEQSFNYFIETKKLINSIKL